VLDGLPDISQLRSGRCLHADLDANHAPIDNDVQAPAGAELNTLDSLG
jgi:hypothetical protein